MSQSVNSALVLELEARIAEFAVKLAPATSGDGEALTQRARKRVMQKIGKLKKDLIAAKEGKITQSQSHSVKRSVDSDGSGGESEDEQSKPKTKKAKVSDQQAVVQESAQPADSTKAKLKKDSVQVESQSKPPSQSVPKKEAKKKDKKKESNESNEEVTTDITQDSGIEATGESTTTISKKEMKKQLHLLNQTLADCAVKKQLSRAKKSFRQAEKKGIVMDVLTYTNLLNVFVRCNDMSGTTEILAEMKEHCVDANIITLTTVLKGYCELGMMREASALFLHHMIPKSKWNIRSLNTFLRGCTRIGGVDMALEAFQLCTSQQALPLLDEAEGQDAATCYESMIALLCRANRVEEATALVLSYVEKNDVISQQVKSHQYRSTKVLENAGLYTMLAKTMTLLGLFSDAKKYLQLATTLIQEGDQANLRDAMLKKFQEVVPSVGGGSGNASDATSKSVELFLAHKRSELKQVLELLEDYMAVIQIMSIKPPKTLNMNVASQLTSEDYVVIEACRLYALALSQMLFFGFDGQSDLPPQPEDTASNSSVADKLMSALTEKFGLRQLQPSHISPHLKHILQTASPRLLEEFQHFIQARVGSMQESCQQRIHNVVTAEGKVDFHALFPDCVFAKRVKKAELPIPQSSNAGKDKPGKGGKYGKNKSNKSTTVQSSSSSAMYDGTLPKEYLKLLKAQSAGNGEDSEDDISEEEEEDESDHEDHPGHVDSEDEDDSKAKIPIKLEIGSGNGDWIVAQAAADRLVNHHNANPNDLSANASQTHANSVTVRGNWIACELRCDRAHHIWSHHFLSTKHLAQSMHSADQEASAVMSGGNNLAVLAGDASKIVKDRIPTESISAIFINYPQPPERVAGDHKNQGKHLLTMEFFLDMMAILKKKGSITILTDNLSYAQSLALTVANINKMKLARRNDSHHELLVSVDMEESEIERRVLQETVPFIDNAESSSTDKKPKKSSTIDVKRQIVIWRGDPGDDAGHIAMVSSYFDRMWSLGQKKRRWFLFLKKKVIENPLKQSSNQK